jgi:hypothetical protein
MIRFRSAASVSLVTLALASAVARAAAAEPDPPPAASAGGAAAPAAAQTPHSSARGVAVVALGPAAGAPGSVRDDAFALARGVYGSALRPPALDEIRARILAGDATPTTTTTSNRELAELRASLKESRTDAASRRLLGGIGRDINAKGLLVVSRAAPPDNAPAGDADGGASEAQGRVQALLFDVETESYDAARYEPDPSASSPWQATVQSVLLRYPLPAPPISARTSAVPPPPREPGAGNEPPSRAFYASPWFWAAVGGAVLLGGFIYLATQDNSAGSIHLQMQVPH